MKPNFFIVGAPKCGTTSLASWLSEHPDVFMSANKEPKFFDTDHLNIHRPTPAEYGRLFAGAKASAIGEASTWYLLSAEAVPNILRYNPDARFIACVRDPVEMAFSLHNQAVFAGIEPLADFARAWDAQGRRRQGIDVPADVEKAMLLYGTNCATGWQVERLQRVAGRDRVHVVFFDDLTNHPASAYRSCLSFLGIDPSFAPAFTRRNGAQARRYPWLGRFVRMAGIAARKAGMKQGRGILSAVDRLNRKPQRYDIDHRLAARLRDYFSEDVKMLAEVTGRDLSRWLPAYSEPGEAILQALSAGA